MEAAEGRRRALLRALLRQVSAAPGQGGGGPRSPLVCGSSRSARRRCWAGEWRLPSPGPWRCSPSAPLPSSFSAASTPSTRCAASPVGILRLGTVSFGARRAVRCGRGGGGRQPGPGGSLGLACCGAGRAECACDSRAQSSVASGLPGLSALPVPPQGLLSAVLRDPERGPSARSQGKRRLLRCCTGPASCFRAFTAACGYLQAFPLICVGLGRR